MRQQVVLLTIAEHAVPRVQVFSSQLPATHLKRLGEPRVITLEVLLDVVANLLCAVEMMLLANSQGD